MDFGAATMTKQEVDAFLGGPFVTTEDGLKAAVASYEETAHRSSCRWASGMTASTCTSPCPPHVWGTHRLRRDPRVAVTVFRHFSPAKDGNDRWRGRGDRGSG